MADETSRAAEVTSSARPAASKPEFENVEFLESALSDPLNVLRLKLQELSSLPAGVVARRVIVIADIVTEDGRSLDVSWSEGADESPWVVQDNIVSMLSRVGTIIVGGD